ncbi:MAG: response regulator transcription factor [Candidatus Eremiobacteraeota bacterium]|nr:response regulator transcription factor [Candidatus Eremiobacteraeota bacterium]
MIRIFIADNYAIVREGLKQILKDNEDMFVIAEAENAWEALKKLKLGGFDVIILDIKLPGIGGVEALKKIKAINPDIPILVLCVYPEEQYALRSIKAGASGYIKKDCSPEELIRAIRKIYKGKKYVSPAFTEKLLETIDAGHKRPLHQNLSDREFQVLCLISRGNTLSEIADELSLSIKTISTYKSRVIRKMGFKNNVELIKYAIENKLIE